MLSVCSVSSRAYRPPVGACVSGSDGFHRETLDKLTTTTTAEVSGGDVALTIGSVHVGSFLNYVNLIDCSFSTIMKMTFILIITYILNDNKERTSETDVTQYAGIEHRR